MIEFKKYKSIENSNREKHINDMFKFNPIYAGCKYIVTEKLDGANFQFRFTRNVDAVNVEFGKRSSILDADDKFYNYQAVVDDPRYVKFIEDIKDFMLNEGKTYKEIIFYGELFGRGIQSRINYGDIKAVHFYDICVDDQYETQEEFTGFMKVIGHEDLMVPIIGIYDSFEEAFTIKVEGEKTRLNPDGEQNLWEGVVIKPYDTIAINKDGEQKLFYIKKKTDSFKDQMDVKSRNRKKDMPVEVTDAQAIFESYLTENRLLDIFGKNGPIESMDQIGPYVKLMIADAKEDFFKNNMEDFDKVPNEYKNKMFAGGGRIISKMLFKHV